MADNTTVFPAVGGDVIRDKDRGGVKTQIVALDLNPAGAEALMAGKLPVSAGDGDQATIGTTTDASSALTLVGLLKAIKAALLGTVTTAPTVAGDGATTLTDGRQTVATPGTAVALRASLACKWVIVTALPTNTSIVSVGGSGTVAASGTLAGSPLAASQSITIPVANAATVFIDARVAAEGVSFTVGA